MKMHVGLILALFTLAAASASSLLWHFGVPTRDLTLSELLAEGPVETRTEVVVLGTLQPPAELGPAWLPTSIVIPIAASVVVAGVAFLLRWRGWSLLRSGGRFQASVPTVAVFVAVGGLGGCALGVVGVALRPVNRGLVMPVDGRQVSDFSQWDLLDRTPWSFITLSVTLWVLCSFIAAASLMLLGYRLIPRQTRV